MKKIYVLLFSSFFIFHFSFSQNGGWWPVDKGIEAGDITALCSYDSVLYVGGSYDSVGGIAANDIAQWNGTNWAPLGQGIIQVSAHISGRVNALEVYHGKLYAGGEFDSAGGVVVSSLAAWNGTNWLAVRNWTRPNAVVGGLCVYNNELYVTGQFDSAGAVPAKNIAKWNDTVWSAIGSGLTGALSGGVCLAVYNGKLYAGGIFDTAGGLPVTDIASWDGTKWDSVGGTKWDGSIYALCSYDSVLYMGGLFHYPGFDSLQDLNHINFIAQWNGTKWDSVGSSYPYWTPPPQITGVVSLHTYDGDLIVGGYSDSGNIARWNGSSWSTMDTGTNGEMFSSAVFKGNLYIGGNFSTAGGRQVFGIAVWGNDTFTGEEELRDRNEELSVYPNPSSGQFNFDFNTPVNGTIEVYDITGQKIYHQTVQSERTEITLSGQPDGMYFYRATTETGNLIGEGKVVIQK